MIKLNNPSYNIIVVGVGGTGSHLVSFLAQLIGNNQDYANKHKIILIDGDIVEEKNLKTQKFLQEDIGKSKAEALADRYSSVFKLDIQYMDRYLTDETDLKNIITRNTIIVSCVDNNKARKIIDNAFNSTLPDNRYSYAYDRELIYIDTGNTSGEDELVGQTVVAYKKGKDIILPSVSTYFPAILEEQDTIITTPSCGEVINTNIQNIGANITSACTTFNILNNIIGFNQITSDLTLFNATQLTSNNMKLNINNVND